MPPGGWDGATIGETVFTKFKKEMSKNILLNNYWTRKVVVYIEASRHTVD
jgi:hypothetical protein